MIASKGIKIITWHSYCFIGNRLFIDMSQGVKSTSSRMYLNFA
jgi:hypothetical protein